MSNPFKAIGKVFKKVVKVVKKVALPVLAIGAVALTGGAALGLLPSIGSIAGSLGLSSTLTGILSSAAQAATFGAVGSALTGGNILKGATMGFVTGGLMGGLGGALGGTANQAAQAATGATDAAGSVANAAGSAGASGASAALPPVAEGASFDQAFSPLASQGGSGGLGTASNAAATAAMPTMAGGNVPTVAGNTAQAVQAANGGGLMGFLNRNPTMSGMILQGLGSGLMASEQAKQAAKERKAIEDSYNGIEDSLFYLPANNGGPALPDAGTTFNNRVYGKIAVDKNTGRLVNVGG